MLGCGTSNDGPPPTAPVTYNCAADTRGETYVPGLVAVGENKVFNFKLISIDPSPPSRGNNSWVVEIDAMMDDVVGAPVSGLCEDGCPTPSEDVTVTPWMPDHQHGSPIIVDTMPAETAGQYTLDPINLWMPGVWTTTIAVTQGSAFDKAVYTFCLAE